MVRYFFGAIFHFVSVNSAATICIYVANIATDVLDYASRRSSGGGTYNVIPNYKGL